jgi:hypothetical protein
LTEQINDQLKQAMKARDEAKVSTLRMLKAGILNAALSKKKQNLEDGEVIEIVQKLIKQHQESVEAFTKAGRSEAAAKEAKEAELLKSFLPPAMDESELKAIVEQTVKELGVSGPSAMGQVMKAVVPKVKGRADNKWVSQLVMQTLGGK